MRDTPSGRERVCPWWLCFTFDNPLRRLLQDPEEILGRFVRPGDRVIDVGAGMGYFSLPLARLVGPRGHVTAIDIQPRMLSALTRRARRNGVAERITPYLATPTSLGQHAEADFILAFWMVHEVPDRRRLLSEIHDLVRPGGSFLLVEPIIHVSGADYRETLQTATGLGFSVRENPRIRFSRSALLSRDGTIGDSTPDPISDRR